MFNSLQPHGMQHARLSCPSPSPGVCSNSCPLSQWCHPTISSSLTLCSPALLPSIFLSIRVFSNESAFCPRWPNMCVCVCVCVYVYTTYLIYLFISWWHSGCFYILTMVNSAVMEHVHLRCMYLIWNSVFIFFSYIPKSGIQIYTLE